MKYENIKKAKFLNRINRFVAEIEINNKIELCHIKNTGRCKELLIKNATIYVQENIKKERKTKYSLISVLKKDLHINMDSQIPNYVALEAIKNNKIEEIQNISFLKAEAKYLNSRFDIYFEKNNGKKGFIEIKGVTLEENGVLKFPDAPSKRAVKHINELIQAKNEGYEVYILFIIQMEKAIYFTPNKETDKDFFNALLKAKNGGISILAYNCFISKDEIYIKHKIEIKIWYTQKINK